MYVYDDDSGNFLGIGHSDDLIDTIQYDVANVPAQNNFATAVATSITVRASTRLLGPACLFQG